MLLITEIFEDIEYLAEAADDGKKSHYIHGIFLQSNIKNRNGRIYPEHVMDKEVNRYINEVVNDKRAWGELGHPNSGAINLDRASHLITELKKDGTNYVGKAKIIDTPMGNIVKGLLESGGKLGTSSRALGSLKPVNGIMEVQPDFHLATAGDIVSDPSGPNCFVNGIMENVNWIYDPIKNTWLEEHLDNVKTSIKKMTMDEIEANKFSIFENYLTKLTSRKIIL